MPQGFPGHPVAVFLIDWPDLIKAVEGRPSWAPFFVVD